MAYCWLIPLAMACLPFTTDNYGDAGAWCSITSKDLKSLVWGTFWRFAVIYVPLWVCIGVNVYMCFKVYRAMRSVKAVRSETHPAIWFGRRFGVRPIRAGGLGPFGSCRENQRFSLDRSCL